MPYKLLADLVVIIHLAWILFMLSGFILALGGFWRKNLFNLWLFRSLHLLGIISVAIFAALKIACPLTIWENMLRANYDPSLTYPGSFMIHYFEKLIYPDVNPLLIRIPTTLVALLSVIIFLVKPPEKIKKLFKKSKQRS